MKRQVVVGASGRPREGREWPLVLKLGGSLLEAGRIAPVLEALAAATQKVAIVPGGGPFADVVREAQKRVGFDDATAHRLAVLAMHQTAQLLVAMQPRLAAAETLRDFDKATARGRIPVWLPYRLCDRDRSIPHDWTITSDGLAARLAERLGASKVVLLKSCKVTARTALPELVRTGVVDPAFGNIVARARLDWRVLGPGNEGELVRLIGASKLRRG